MKRVAIFIDGFNLYHALDDNPHLRQYRWLDVVGLAKSILHLDETLVDTCFFTTIVSWDSEKEKQQRAYIKALEWSGAKMIFGEFHKKIIQEHFIRC